MVAATELVSAVTPVIRVRVVRVVWRLVCIILGWWCTVFWGSMWWCCVGLTPSVTEGQRIFEFVF